MTLYIGGLFGYVGLIAFTDNYGRKFSMVLAWALVVLGTIILSSSVDIWMAVIGLFLAGLGCDSFLRISMTLIG